MTKRRSTCLVATALGMLMFQFLWMTVIAPFGGSDQFDHAYKAASVARGDWFPEPTDATRGTGALLDVPNDIVEAARPQCEALDYTTEQDCVGTPNADGSRRVASGAGRYNPLYYAVVGWAALPFKGYTAYFAMRLCSALLCWVLFGVALVIGTRRSVTPWPLLAILIAATPVLLYSTSLVAPNGLEMMAALVLWLSLWRVFGESASGTKPSLGVLLAVATSGTLLVTLRSLGPLWCLLILLTVAVAAPAKRRSFQQLAAAPGAWFTAGFVLVATVLSVVWVRFSGALNLGGTGPPMHLSLTERLELVPARVVEWTVASVAAFPHRNDPSHPIVYACYFVLFIALLALGLRAGTPRERGAIIFVALATLAIPAAIMVETYNEMATPWQGRYGLPLAIGMPLVAGLALERTRRPCLQTHLLAIGLLWMTAQVVALTHVLVQQQDESVLQGTGHWQHPSSMVTLLLGIFAAVVTLPHRPGRGPTDP